MNPTHILLGFVAITIVSLVAWCAIGITCQRGGERAGRQSGYEQGKADGRREGWDDAHERVAAALKTSRPALDVALLEIELTQLPPSPVMSGGEPMVALHGLCLSHQEPESLIAG